VIWMTPENSDVDHATAGTDRTDWRDDATRRSCACLRQKLSVGRASPSISGLDSEAVRDQHKSPRTGQFSPVIYITVWCLNPTYFPSIQNAERPVIHRRNVTAKEYDHDQLRPVFRN
jgi:hypothetical protein